MKDERGIHHLGIVIICKFGMVESLLTINIVITNAQQDDEGEYSVVATNPLGNFLCFASFVSNFLWNRRSSEYWTSWCNHAP